MLQNAKPALVTLIMIALPDHKGTSCKHQWTHLTSVAANVLRTKIKMKKIEYEWDVTHHEQPAVD